VTALGIASPIGIGPEDFWGALVSGSNAAGPVRAFDASAFGVDVGCELDPDVELAGSSQTGRAARLAATAGAQALDEAGLSASERAGTALCVGTTMGEACWVESWGAELLDATEDQLPANELLRSGPDQIGSDVAELLGLRGGHTVVGGACAAGNYAISRAMDLVRLGRSERVLAGGTDSFSRVAYTGFARLGALARDACRPFSADRDGLVLGEGAAMLLIESADAARARRAAPLARLAGAGLSCDAHHIVSPHPEGDGVTRALRAALAEAGSEHDDVDWICAHGTGTPANDAAEVRAAGAVFGAERPPMSSIKALTGHSLGAASAFEAVACVLALQRQVIPPTWNFNAPAPDCAWDVVPGAARQSSLSTVINNASAFGGANAAVVLRREA
jgi:3-oxoacyl-[acyl-carrier-protein] synthase II